MYFNLEIQGQSSSPEWTRYHIESGDKSILWQHFANILGGLSVKNLRVVLRCFDKRK